MPAVLLMDARAGVKGSSLEAGLAGSPPVKIAPTYDCSRKFCRTRPTNMLLSKTPGISRVRTFSTPISVRPALPVSLRP